MNHVRERSSVLGRASGVREFRAGVKTLSPARHLYGYGKIRLADLAALAGLAGLGPAGARRAP